MVCNAKPLHSFSCSLSIIPLLLLRLVPTIPLLLSLKYLLSLFRRALLTEGDISERIWKDIAERFVYSVSLALQFTSMCLLSAKFYLLRDFGGPVEHKSGSWRRACVGWQKSKRLSHFLTFILFYLFFYIICCCFLRFFLSVLICFV